MNNEPEIIIIGAAILDILACPVDEIVFHNGSTPASEIRMSTGGDALNEATVLACLGKRVQLETTLGRDEAGEYIQRWCESIVKTWKQRGFPISAKSGILFII